MPEHYKQLLDNPQVLKIFENAGYVSGDEFNALKEERNNLLHTLLSYHKQIEDHYSSRHTTMPENDFFKNIFKKNIITSSFIKENLITFLIFSEYSHLDSIALAQKGKERKKIIKESIVQLGLKNSRKDSNFKNLINIFEKENIKNTEYFFLFFDSLNEVQIKNLANLKISEIKDFVENNFNNILNLIINK
tara:strand:- start:12664 stop:13236 length:573 start_codon:yes stop_codon:yes gene_type:complete